MQTLQDRIAKLPLPTLYEESSFEAIKAQMVAMVKGLNPDWTPVESDSNMLQIGAFAYREVMLRKLFNQAITKMLPHLCENDEDLDNFIFGFYGAETRIDGKEPVAPYEVELEEPLNVDVIVPKGLQLSDGKEHTAYINENITIAAGELTATGEVKLDKKVKSSEVKTEIVISPFPYVINVTSQGDFTDGVDRESNEEFLERAILGLYQYSTAGGKKAYEYYAKSADARVFDVKILRPQARYIDVVLIASENETETLSAVQEAMTNDEKAQAFDDVVTVRAATKKQTTVNATVHLYDLTTQSDVDTNIKANTKNEFKIGESLPYSSLVTKIHIGGVYKVVLDTTTDIEVLEDEYIDLVLNLTYVGATS